MNFINFISLELTIVIFLSTAETDWADGQELDDVSKPYSTIVRSGDSYDWQVEPATSTANAPLQSANERKFVQKYKT